MSTTHCTQCDGLGDGYVYAAPCQTCEGTGQAPTRRIERPGPPSLPKGWAPYGLGMLRYASETITGVALDIGDVTLAPWARTWQPLPERLAVKIEVAQATLDILTYLRAHLAYQSRTAPVTSGSPSPLAEAGRGEGIGAPAQLGESLR